MIEPNKRIRHKQETLAQGKDFKRWRMWHCFQGLDSEVDVKKEIMALKERGFKAKVWATLPQHKTSGHVHVVVLATFHEFCKLAGLKSKRRIVCGRSMVVTRNISTSKIESCLGSLRKVRGYAFVGENVKE